MSRKLLCTFGLAALVVVVSGCSDDDDPTDPIVEGPTSFTLTIKNVSSAPLNAGGVETPLAPGVWAVTTSGTPIFDSGQIDRGEGLEALAEDGMNATLAGSLTGRTGVVSNGTIGTAGIGTGESFSATFEAEAGQKLNFATMYVASNDLFFSPSMTGINLFNGEDPISGDITSMVGFYDAGTEINEEPGVGMYQPQRGVDGPTEGIVQPVMDGYTYPAVGDVVSATVSSVTDASVTTFTVRVDNIGTGGEVLAPGAYAVHTGANPLFTNGSPDNGMGLEELAEDGNKDVLVASLAGNAQAIASGAVGAAGQPENGDVFEFSFVAEDGQKLSFATMYVQTNDLFYAPVTDGIDLFTSGAPIGDGTPLDITGMLGLWDAGTEINYAPGSGTHQPPAAGGPNEGVVQSVMDGFSYGAINDVVEVTLTVN